ncbi:hypothetical protein SAMN06273572_102312 [Monaibacterium marinum]|uniref:Lipoprotein n=1 Tax=Pontivivens marinum TaxID=1690039 RepID=A0A2C9CQL9_9RHOB|nr:hypothetical protein [Monaibacterium marinum]SOH93634.1 hypothetical protein SAMN06273572_102312 [Monaibacterium marinum]
MTAVKSLAALSLVALLAACAGPGHGPMHFAPTESAPMNNLNLTHIAPGF